VKREPIILMETYGTKHIYINLESQGRYKLSLYYYFFSVANSPQPTIMGTSSRHMVAHLTNHKIWSCLASEKAKKDALKFAYLRIKENRNKNLINPLYNHSNYYIISKPKVT